MLRPLALMRIRKVGWHQCRVYCLKNLVDLLSLLDIELHHSMEITHLTLDSRDAIPGTLFIACKGTEKDGRHYMDDAISRGAVAILQEGDNEIQSYHDIPLISLRDLREDLSTLAAFFYDYPLQHLTLIGVTGTNGKTSITQLLAQAFTALGKPAAVIGSLGNGVLGTLSETKNTTPDAITLQQLFATYVKQGIKVVAMEVSSHALDQGRVAGLLFDVGIFTNLTQDHLDYHGTMEAYGASKKKLFNQVRQVIINQDDAMGIALLNEFGGMAYSQHNTLTDYPCLRASEVKQSQQGMQFTLASEQQRATITTSLIGTFNVSNLLAVIACLLVQGESLHHILAVVPRLQPVPGRMETVRLKNGVLAIVDYAHTPDALAKALQAARPFCEGRLFCVFGCGGDRDRKKRPLMASTVERYADRIIVTQDNVRHESPVQIVADILQGFSPNTDVMIEEDRAAAIRFAMHEAVAGDVVIIAGKGREPYQDVQGVKIPYSDFDVLK